MPIVEAVGTAVRSQDMDLAARLERALSDVVTQALAEGVSISDSAELGRRMQDAREAFAGRS